MGKTSNSSVYVPGRSWTNVVLNQSGEAAEDFGSYADAYRRAGQTLFEATFARDPKHSYEADAMPIAFLYRHAVELYLKAIVRRGNVLLSMAGREQATIRGTHSLIWLLDDVRLVFEHVSPSWEADRQEFRQLVADLEKDDLLGIDDGSGDMWRYPVRKNGDVNHLPKAFAFDVNRFVQSLDEFLNTLSGAVTGLEHHIDSLGEQLFYAQQDANYSDYHDNQYYEDYEGERS